MFGKEPTSREAYDQLEDQTNKANDIASENRGSTTLEEHTLYGDQHPKFHPSVAQKRFEKLRDKLEAMKASGHKEALALESKHNTLIRNLEVAQTALAAFEEEQLGMHRD